MKTIGTLPTTNKATFFNNVEFNINLLQGLVIKFENEFDNETNPDLKANKMMLLLDAELQLRTNLELAK